MVMGLRKHIDRERVHAAITAAERGTAGEIVVAVSPWFWGNVERAAQRAFAKLGIGKTSGHTGVMIFVCPRRRHAIVLGDAAIHAAAGQPLWNGAAAAIEAGGRSGDLTGGVVRAIELVAAELAVRFPRGDKVANELVDDPVRG